MRCYAIGHARKFSFSLYDDEKFPYVTEFLLHFLDPQVFVMSPLHHGDGHTTADHYHIYLQYDGLVPCERVERIAEMLHTTRPVRVINTKPLIRYFCHYDNPDKEQFDPSELYVYGDFDVKQFF